MFNNATEKTEAAVDALQENARQAGCHVRSMLQSAGKEASHCGEKIASDIRANPVRASVIALGLGMVFGALLRR